MSLQPASYLPFCSVPIQFLASLGQGCLADPHRETLHIYPHQVLFPLLTKLLENISPADVGGMEETRMRASTLLSKVLLTTLHPPSLPYLPFRKEGNQGFWQDLRFIVGAHNPPAMDSRPDLGTREDSES